MSVYAYENNNNNKCSTDYPARCTYTISYRNKLYRLGIYIIFLPLNKLIINLIIQKLNKVNQRKQRIISSNWSEETPAKSSHFSIHWFGKKSKNR